MQPTPIISNDFLRLSHRRPLRFLEDDKGRDITRPFLLNYEAFRWAEKSMIQIEITNGSGPTTRSAYPCIIRVIESTRVVKTNWVRGRERVPEQKRNNEPIH